MSSIDRGASAPSFLALGCVGFIASATPALAQTTQPQADQPRLGGVTVTDTAIEEDSYKTEQLDSPQYTAPLIDTPRSVVVVPKQIIRDTGSATLLEALRTVPGITFGAGEGGNPIGDRPFIRGVDSQASTYLDGVRDIGAQSREVFNLEQIEIVKGSNSAVGGRGGAGGTLNLVSKAPQSDGFVAGAASYGSDDYKRVTFDVNQSLGQSVGIRLNGMYHDQDVAGREALFQERWGIAPAVTLGLDGPTSATFSYYHLESDELPDSGFPYQYTIGNAPAGVTETAPVEVQDGRKVDRDNFYGLTNRDFRETNVDQVTLRLEHRFSDALTLRNTSRYGHSEQAYIFTNPDDSAGNVAGTGSAPTNQPSGRVARSPKNRFSATELLVNQTDLFGEVDTGSMRHAFAAGIEIAREVANRGSFTIVSTPRCENNAGANGSAPGSAPYNCTDLFDPNPDDPFSGSVTRNAPGTTTITRANTKSAYLFDTITLTPALIANLGLRYDHFSTRIRGPEVAGTRPDFGRSDGLWSYQAGLVFKPAENASLYASTSTSNTPPGSFIGEGAEGNAFTALNVNDLKVEKTRSYEVGGKVDLFGEQLSLTLAGFRTETDNARTTGANNVIEFVGQRRIDGIEFGFNGKITPEWNVFGGYTYLDSVVRNGGLTATTVGGVTLYAPSVNTGRRFPNTPEHSFTAYTNFNVTPALKIGGGAIYNSKVYGGYADQRTIQNGEVVITKELARYVPAYWRFDASLAYRFSDRIELQLNAQNLFDERYYDKAYSTHYAAIAPGRSVFATLNFRY